MSQDEEKAELLLDEPSQVLGLDEEEAKDVPDGAQDLVIVESSDGCRVCLPRRATQFSELLREVFADPQTTRVPIPHLSGVVLRLCAEWMTHLNRVRNHRALMDQGMHQHPKGWMSIEWLQQQQFINMDDFLRRCLYDDFQIAFLQLDIQLTFNLLLAAHYLDIKTLMCSITVRIAMSLREQSAPEILRTFGIEQPPPETAERLNAEFGWLVPQK